jgi:hypothetical protein
MASWQVQDAKARFSKSLDATLKEGPKSLPAVELKPLSSSPLRNGGAGRKCLAPD